MTLIVQVTNEIERRAARRILRGRGMPTAEVHRMSYAALTSALGEVDQNTWNVTLAWATAATLRHVPSKAPASSPSANETVPSERSAETESETKAKESDTKAESEKARPSKDASKDGPRDALEARVREIISETMRDRGPDPKPALDIDAVRKVAEKVAQEAVEAAALPVRISVSAPDQPVRETPEGETTHYMMPQVLKALSAHLHLWLPGPAGSGKSTLGRQAFELLGYSEPVPGEPAETPRRIHMTGAIETPFQLTGYRSPNGDPATLMTPFRKAWQYGGAFIFDDVDRSNPKALAAFNEALANGHCAFPDGVVKAHDDFICVATANTFGLGGGTDYVGAARLDKATLDRFVYIEIPYDEKQERAIAGPDGSDWCKFVQRIRKAVRKLGLKHLVTPRATYKGLRLLAAGMDRADVEAATVYAGLDAETLARVKDAAKAAT